MENNYQFKNLLTDADMNAGFTTIGFCLAVTESLIFPDSISMKGIRSVLDVKYSREDWIEYRPMDSSTIEELFGMDLEFLTPVLLTKTRSPFMDAINQLDAPHDFRVRSNLNPICYAALWQINKVPINNNNLNSFQDGSNYKMFREAHAVATKGNKNFVVFAVPGWSYDNYLSHRLRKVTRSRMSKEGMIATDRICED